MNSLVDYVFNAGTKAAKKDSPILANNEIKDTIKVIKALYNK